MTPCVRKKAKPLFLWASGLVEEEKAWHALGNNLKVA